MNCVTPDMVSRALLASMSDYAGWECYRGPEDSLGYPFALGKNGWIYKFTIEHRILAIANGPNGRHDVLQEQVRGHAKNAEEGYAAAIDKLMDNLCYGETA